MNEHTSKRLRIIFTVLAVAGLLISIYLLTSRYAHVPLECPNNGIINCGTVLSSSYAYLFGIPLEIYGIAFFIIELALIALPSLYRIKDLQVIYNMIGIGFVAYFIYLESLIGKICIFCTGVHVIIAILFILSLYRVMR